MIKKINYLLLFVAVFATISLKAQHKSTTPFARLDSFLIAANTSHWVAGHTALVIKEGKTVFSQTHGFRDREANSQMKQGDIFRMASMTKPVVTVAAMILVEKGKLKLDDDLAKFIPEFKNLKMLKSYDVKTNTWTADPANSPITIRHLMTHTSGIGAGLDDKILGTLYVKNGFNPLMVGDSITLETAIKKLAALPLAVHPGTKFHYGLSSDVLGRVIEIVAKMPLDQFINKHIFSPLNMSDTHFFQPQANEKRLAVLYGEFQSGKLSRIPQGFQGYNINYPISGPKTYLSGAAGLSGTIGDYAKFLQMIVNNGSLNGVRILKPGTVALMAQNQIGNISLANSNKFGLGFEIENRQVPPRKASVGKLSWGGAFNTTFWIDPTRKTVAILMTQVYPALHQRDLYSGFEKFTNEALDLLN